jgi:Pyruvate/2-oxoacid:ferredoxin oxidoreductase gamma subunit
MGPETKLLVNQGKFVLPNLIRQGKSYPPLEQIVSDICTVVRDVVLVDGPGALEKVGRARTLNIFMLGAIMELGWLPFEASTLWPAIARRCKSDYLEANRMAFDLGRESVTDQVGERNFNQE